MRTTTVLNNYRRGLRGCTVLASTATLTAAAAVLATSLSAQAAVSHGSDTIAPDAIALSSTLKGVSADSAADAWAVGGYSTATGGGTLVLHWTGTNWTKLRSPAPSGATSVALSGVSAVSPTDVWTAGYYGNSSGGPIPLIERWNGTGWKPVTAPLPSGATEGALQGVSAVSATDTWAAGFAYTNNGNDLAAVLEHCNGKTCTLLASHLPTGAVDATLSGVSAVSATDAWAVGSYQNTSGVDEPLVLHCSGKTCMHVTSTAPSGATITNLSGVSAVSATGAWAAGYSYNGSGVSKALVLHCNGTTCKPVTSPAPSGAQAANLYGVSAASATNAWTVGTYTNSSGVVVPLIQQCGGTTCSPVTSPTVGGTSSLWGVSAASKTAVWAVGNYEANAIQETLTLHYTDGTWKHVKSPNGA
jgi:hypothetical protein